MNKKRILVKFTILYNNPTFMGLFNRYKLTAGEWIEMNVNHQHYSDILRLAPIFKYEVK
jgi:hypothetical protein